MEDPALIDSINNLAQAIERMRVHYWWDTQWFSALIGAITGLLGSGAVSAIRERNKRLFNYHQWFLGQGTFSSPDTLLKQAQITSYASAEPGDKPLGEKMVIELRSHTKYWYEPLSMIRFLLSRYEAALWKIKNGRKGEVENTSEYKEAEKRFKAVEDFIYRKTGENEWTS